MLEIHSCVTHRCMTKNEIHIVTRTVQQSTTKQINVTKLERQVDHVNIEYIYNRE